MLKQRVQLFQKMAAWFVDGLAAIRTFKRKETYEKWMEGLLQFITPSKSDDPTLIGMINDTYLQLSGARTQVPGIKEEKNSFHERTLKVLSSMCHLELNGKNSRVSEKTKNSYSLYYLVMLKI